MVCTGPPIVSDGQMSCPPVPPRNQSLSPPRDQSLSPPPLPAKNKTMSAVEAEEMALISELDELQRMVSQPNGQPPLM